MELGKLSLGSKKVHGKHKINPYVSAYLKAHDLAEGDTWNIVEYMTWIDKKHDEFRHSRSAPDFISYNDKGYLGFLQFIGL